MAYDTVGKYVQLRQDLSPAARSGAREWGRVAEFSRAISAVLAAGGGETQQPATAEEQQAAQERALWELMAVFSVWGAGTSEGVGGPELALWLAGNWAALAAGAGSTGPLPPALRSQLQESALPEAHPRFWPAVQRLVGAGQVGAAVELLGLHSAWLRWDGGAGAGSEGDAQVAALEAATLLLKRFPTLRSSSSSSSSGETARRADSAREFDTLQECLTYR